ncbi:MAG: hypothetical protein K2F53_03360, partial [Rikenellaceae bacterium]|nr:hypothetical protein [Rikenellaceae bacterium]
MKRTLPFIVMLLCACLFTACDSDQIRILKYGKPDITSITNDRIDFTVEMSVYNNSSKMTIKQCDILLKQTNSGKEILSVSAKDKIVVRKGMSSIKVPISIRINGGIFAAQAIMKKIKINSKDISV